MPVIGKLTALALTLALSCSGVHAYNKFCSQDSDCDAPGSYCMKDPTKQPFNVYYCHGDQDFCRGDGDCEPGDYCLNDPPHAPMQKYMCAGALKNEKTKKVEARVVFSSFDKDWCYATAGTDAKKCASLVKEKKCTWYASKDGKTGKCAMPKKEGEESKPFYHVMAKGDNQCYQTRYIDANYKKQGYTRSKCPSNFKIQSKSNVKVCFMHSDINIKDCKTTIKTITILKMGVAADVEGEVIEGDDQQQPVVEKTRGNFRKKGQVELGLTWHVLSSKSGNQCYESNYSDRNFRKQGYRFGKCPSAFNKITSVDKEQVCFGHSEVAIKDCSTKVVTISITRKGKSTK